MTGENCPEQRKPVTQKETVSFSTGGETEGKNVEDMTTRPPHASAVGREQGFNAWQKAPTRILKNI